MLASALLACALVACAGCAMRGDVEVLESELRRREQAQEELAGQLAAVHDELRVARDDAAALRSQLAGRQQVALASEQAEVLYRAQAIRFNMLLTSGQDRDGQPGDEGLSVLIMPVDSQGDLVKLAGSIDLELFDLSLDADRQRLGHWSFLAEEVREHWHRGFLSAGYLFQLDWQKAPASAELTLHARLTAPDGRQFDATAQIRVSPPGPASAAPVARAKHESLRPERPEEPFDEAPLDDQPLDVPPLEMPALEEPSPLTTSDNWTEETIPRLR